VEDGEGSREIMQIFLVRDVSGMRYFLIVWIWANKKNVWTKRKII
jgi:hypothetical protein